jgi:hypothetical protein
MELQHYSKLKFEPMEILPLVNLAFPIGFDRQEIHRKQLQVTGKPLDYKILATLPKKEACNLTTENNPNTLYDTIEPLSINFGTCVMSYFLYNLVKEEWKQEGRKLN